MQRRAVDAALRAVSAHDIEADARAGFSRDERGGEREDGGEASHGVVAQTSYQGAKALRMQYDPARPGPQLLPASGTHEKPAPHMQSVRGSMLAADR